MLSTDHVPGVEGWALFSGSILPIYRCVLVSGQFSCLVGLYFFSAAFSRCIVRVEWLDGNVWFFCAEDCPQATHVLGFGASSRWAMRFCESARRDWVLHSLREEDWRVGA